MTTLTIEDGKGHLAIGKVLYAEHTPGGLVFGITRDVDNAIVTIAISLTQRERERYLRALDFIIDRKENWAREQGVKC